jgi:hypothetical protein
MVSCAEAFLSAQISRCDIGGAMMVGGVVCDDSYMESLCCDSAFAHKKEFYIFKFPKRFLEIS